jgi:tRNA(Phe) wybutosine-synthesizing methylase Tyw3
LTTFIIEKEIKDFLINRTLKKVSKGVWGMPRLSEAMKDVISCEKLRGGANNIDP